MRSASVTRWSRRAVAAIAFALVLVACETSQPLVFAGVAQGTTYHVTVAACSTRRTANDLQQRIEQRLAEIDRALSNYRDDSELSRFNQAPAGEWVELGADLYSVLLVAQQISEHSEGAFDVTVAPLVDLWGFGSRRREGVIPSAADIARARASVDFHQLEIDPVQVRVKKHRALTIDVNGIAQGYTVDQLAKELTAAGCSDYLVEIGGELRLAGHNAERQLWRIGIEKPVDGLGDAEQVLHITNVGVTTAGDYHEYFEKAGVRYSHTIDPRTGRPVTHTLASVTVVAANATLADGWDTALEVLGPDAGFSFAQAHGIAAFFIVREGDHFSTRYTAPMAALLRDRAAH